MAAIDEKISDLTSLTEAASNDLIPLVDVSEDKTTNIRKDRLFGSPGQIGWDNSNTGKFTTILLDSGATVNEISTDVLFSAASNIQLSTSLAVKTYVDTQVAILPEHNTLISIQGGDSTNIYHLTVEQHDGLTEGGITFLHTHSVGSFDHNTLGGLQGGDSVSEFYHFDLQTYSQITSDSTTSVIFSEGIDVNGHSAMGTVDIDYPGFPTFEALLRLNETFDSGVVGWGRGIEVVVDSDASDSGTILIAIKGSALLSSSSLHSEITGGSFLASADTDPLVLTDAVGVTGTASVSGDNSLITNAIGGKFTASSGFSMVNAVVDKMAAGEFQILNVGSGDVDITNGYGALIKTPGFTPSGTLTNLYGLYIEDQSGSGFGSDYNLYSAGVNSNNKFEGNIDIDGNVAINSSDTTALVVVGDIHCDNLFTSGNTIHLGNIQLTEDTDGLKVTGTVNASDPVSSSDLVTLDFMSKLGTDRQRLTYDGTANLDISVEHIVDVKYVDFLDNEDAPPWQEGRVFWDKGNNTFGVYNDVPDVTLQVGQETHIKIRNESGLLIPNGSICYVVGASQGRALVLLASATSELTSEGIVVVTHDLDNNTDGYGTIVGMVRDIGTGGIVEGDQLYLSATVEGGFTSVRPSAPNYVVDLGTVITTDGTMGDILVQILNHGDFATLADVSLVDSPNNGETLVYDGANDFWISESQPKVVSYTLPLSGVTDVQVPLTGSFIVKDTGQTADVTDDFAVSNQHLWVLTNSVTLADSTGTITITGTSLSESTAVPVIGDTEVITIDSTAETYYQSIKKWWDITNIDISADIPVIDFDYGIVGYPDFGNRNFKILGYRMDAFSSGVSPDMRLIITKVHDLGDNKVEFIELEDIGVDSGAIGDQIIDHVRSGVDDRSYNPPVTDIWANDETLTFKQLDFDEYWTNDENHINAAIAQEGIFIRIEGEPPGGGITNVDFVNLVIFFAII